MADFQEKIYLKLPYFLKYILVNIQGFKFKKQRYNKDFYTYYDTYNRLWDEDIDTVKNYQKEALKQLLLDGYTHTVWYRKIMDDLGINPEQINADPYEVLSKMPILEKKDRKNNTESIINTDPKRKLVGVGHTSGTTGSPTVTHIDLETVNRSFALWKRFHHTIGLDIIERQVRLSGRFVVHPDRKKPPFWVYNKAENQLIMSTYNLVDKNLPHYIDKLNKFKPTLIDGFPTLVTVLSKYINQNNIALTFTPKAICVTAETLYDFQRIEIEKAFKCKVYNQYASSEGSPFITECKAGNLHVNIDSGYFEFLNAKGEAAKPNEVANMVVTSFRNLKTPLIRYNIGDTVILSENQQCTCGCAMPIIKKISGREDDILWTEERGYVTIDIYHEGLEDIIKSELIQYSPDKMVLNLIVNGEYTKTMDTILLNHLKERLGKNVNYTINIVDDIPLSANGKFVAVKRKFKVE